MITIWTIDADRCAGSLPARLALLGPDERERAGGFVHERDRTRFIVAHSLVRSVLGRCTGRSAASLRFTAGPRGKPELVDARGWHFNLSHSGPLAALAVCEGRAIGIDIEDIRAVPPDGVREYETWVMKEAWVKATGEGLQALERFSPTSCARQQLEGYAIMRWDLMPGYAAALAVQCAPEEAVPTQLVRSA
jgi:phosphopantetheinyl transferase